MINARLLICAVAIGLAVPSVALAADVDPVPGDWIADGEPAKARGATATVSFSIDEGTGLVQPVVSYTLPRRCRVAGKQWTETVPLGAVAVTGGKFAARDRHARGKVRIKLRVQGTFDSEVEAHGTVRGKVLVRAGGRRRAVVCALPKLEWSASLDELLEDDEFADDDEFGDDDEFDEDDEPIEEDEGGADGDPEVDPDDGL